jgi:uncharacterized protein YcbK (DUF882 family)
MSKISKNFTWAEFTASDTAKRLGILNHITDWDVRDNAIALFENLIQPARDALGKPIEIGPNHSGYRCPALNKAVGGVDNSQHQYGEAADCGVDDVLAFARLIIELGLPFDQMGLYPTFVHLSYKRECNGKNRGQVFYAKSYKGDKVA